MNDSLAKHYLESSISLFRQLKALAEKAMRQVSDEEFFVTLDAESNNLALIVKHVAGNLRSRWTDFLTSDGEKEWRRRDTEFILDDADTRDRLQQHWEAGWQTLFDALEPLTEEDFDRQVVIRGEPHTIVEAINRQLTHYSIHVGQIVFLAKHLKSSAWKTLSVPRGQSETFRQQMLEKHKEGLRTED